MTLTFNTCTLISSFRGLLLLPFTSLAVIVSEKSTVDVDVNGEVKLL